MNITEATERACQEPTLLDALSWICVWESERAIDQARNRYGSGTNGAGWDTCFKVCLEEVLKKYPQQVLSLTEIEDLPNPDYVKLPDGSVDIRTSRLLREQAVAKAQFRRDWLEGTRWIDAKKQHPKVDQKVLVYEQFWNVSKTKHYGHHRLAVFVRGPQDHRTYGYVDPVGWGIDQREGGTGRGVLQYADVTHWMPLPDAPTPKAKPGETE